MENKQEFEKVKAIYQAHHYNQIIWVWTAFLLLLGVAANFGLHLGSSMTTTGFWLIVLLYAILLHVQNRKLKLRSTVSIMIYIINFTGLVATILLILGMKMHNYLALWSSLAIIVVNLILMILIIIFAFLAARKIQKANPNFVQDYKSLKKIGKD